MEEVYTEEDDTHKKRKLEIEHEIEPMPATAMEEDHTEEDDTHKKRKLEIEPINKILPD